MCYTAMLVLLLMLLYRNSNLGILPIRYDNDSMFEILLQLCILVHSHSRSESEECLSLSTVTLFSWIIGSLGPIGSTFE